jgi:hypothetical protein
MAPTFLSVRTAESLSAATCSTFSVISIVGLPTFIPSFALLVLLRAIQGWILRNLEINIYGVYKDRADFP